MRNALLLLLLVLSNQANAQHDAYSTFFWNKMSLFNPAVSGVNYRYQGTLMGQEQFAGIKGAPFYLFAAYDMKLDPLHGGAGAFVTYEKGEPWERVNAEINYSFHVKLPGDKTLSMGASGGMVYQNYRPGQMGYPPFLKNAEEKFTTYDLNFGLLFKSEHLDLGLSSSHEKIPEEWLSNTKYTSDYFAFGSYRVYVSDHLVIQPTILLRVYNQDINMAQVNSGLMVALFEKLWAGFTYSTDDFYNAMIGYDFNKKFRIGYSFDYKATNDAGNINYGNHELILAVLIK